MQYVSLFSGIEAASVAWEAPLGWRPIAFAEIDEFASAVLDYRWPDVPNYGDVSKMDGRPFRGIADVVVGGSPCQDVSVAGKRAGFRDATGAITRSGLFFEMARIVDEAQPRYWLLENVPGMLSSQHGEDFKTVLAMFEELGYIIDTDILDAQWFGVPQRRRRVFVIGERVDALFAHTSPRSTLVLAQCLCELATATLLISRDMSKGKKKTDIVAKYSAEGIQHREKLFQLSTHGRNLVAHHLGADFETMMATDRLVGYMLGSAAGAAIDDETLLSIAQYTLPIATLTATKNHAHPSYWTAAEAASDFLREYRNYGARQANGTLFDDVAGVHQWRDFERQARDTDDALCHP